jgi:mono/diheme cytochrome c family protein
MPIERWSAPAGDRLGAHLVQPALRIGRRLVRGAGRAAANLLGHALGLLFFATAAGAALVYSGYFNVGAARQTSGAAEMVRTALVQRSVAARARDIAVPPLDTIGRLVRGAELYRGSCEACHRAPGVARSDIADGFDPPPADLSLSAGRWMRAELFWIVKNGIRLSGMPAWDHIHTDEEIWDIVSFVSRLPQMSAAEYRELQFKSRPE